MLEKNKSVNRGNRIKSARMLAGMSRKKFAESSGISTPTLRAWEKPSGNRRGLTNKGAVRLSESFRECGIECSSEWLLEGVGTSPQILHFKHKSETAKDTNQHIWQEEEAILKDIESFKANNINAVVTTISDRGMAPFYELGDLVGGRSKVGTEIKTLIGLNCIVFLEHKTLIRKIYSCTENNQYTLSAYNQSENIPDLIAVNVEIINAAEIVWHRKRETIKSFYEDS